MLTYDLERRGDLPRYDYLYRCIKGDILSGRLAAGEKLPSKRALAAHLGTAVVTVENAYAQLLAEGYLTSGSGRAAMWPRWRPGRAPLPLRPRSRRCRSAAGFWTCGGWGAASRASPSPCGPS